MLRQDKETFVEDMRQQLSDAQGVLFLDYTGLTVAEAEKLRRTFREANIGYRVVKNTLMARALEGSPVESAGQLLKGSPTGVVLGSEDPVATAKATFDFIGQCDHVQVKCGILEGKTISAAEAEGLSKMPSKTEIQATVVSQALSPGRTLAGQFKAPAGRLVGAVDKLVERLEAAA